MTFTAEDHINAMLTLRLEADRRGAKFKDPYHLVPKEARKATGLKPYRVANDKWFRREYPELAGKRIGFTGHQVGDESCYICVATYRLQTGNFVRVMCSPESIASHVIVVDSEGRVPVLDGDEQHPEKIGVMVTRTLDMAKVTALEGEERQAASMGLVMKAFADAEAIKPDPNDPSRWLMPSALATELAPTVSSTQH